MFRRMIGMIGMIVVPWGSHVALYTSLAIGPSKVMAIRT